MRAVVAVETRSAEQLLDHMELLRLDARRRLNPAHRSELGQVLTPPPVARFMASLFGPLPAKVRVLDAGAGVGTLFSAVVAAATGQAAQPKDFQVVAYELDPLFAEYLDTAMNACRSESAAHGMRFRGEIVRADFIGEAAEDLAAGPFKPSKRGAFTHTILNPPYKKLRSGSAARLALRRVGIEASNLYAAFLALAVRLLDEGGELCAITPRSFCNGPYFRPFRELFLGAMNLRRIHVFESRTSAFGDEVLQETVVIHAVKARQAPKVVVSSSAGPDEDVSVREVAFEDIVRPGDPERFIHVVPDERGQRSADLYARFASSLHDLGVGVSTGRVVDFRAKSFLRPWPDTTTGPLIYPAHVRDGAVAWPKTGKKPNALVDCPATAGLWVPSGTYVVVKRVSSKEEKRRVVAAIFDPALVSAKKIGFENHLNVFHSGGAGLEPSLARGLSAFLNSTLVDTCFRQFNGHTQVNATDLRSLKYPSSKVLCDLGRRLDGGPENQKEIDELVEGLASTSPAPLRKR